VGGGIEAVNGIVVAGGLRDAPDEILKINVSLGRDRR